MYKHVQLRDSLLPDLYLNAPVHTCMVDLSVHDIPQTAFTW